MSSQKLLTHKVATSVKSCPSKPISLGFRVTKILFDHGKPLCLHAFHGTADTPSGFQALVVSFFLPGTYIHAKMFSITYWTDVYTPISYSSKCYSALVLKILNIVVPVILELSSTESSENQHFYCLLNSLSYR